MGGRGIADRDVQDERRRSAALLRRPADTPRQRLAPEPHRRADALALGRREKHLIVKRPGEGSESAAYGKPAMPDSGRDIHLAIRDTLRGIARKLGRPQVHATALTTPEIRR